MFGNFLLAFLILLSSAHAALVTYVDDKGVKHVVQNPEEIPEKYRGKAKAVGKGEVNTKAADKWTLEFCTAALQSDRKSKLQVHGKEEAQLMAGGDAETNPELKEKLQKKRQQIDELSADMKGCSSRYKKEQMK